MAKVSLHDPDQDYFPLYGDDMQGPPICGSDIWYIQNLLSEAVENLGGDPFMGTLAIDWLDESGQVLERVVRLDVEDQYDGKDARDEFDRCNILIAAKEARRLIDDSFDLVATIKIANHLGWLTAPIQKFLYTIPEKLFYANEKIKLREGEGTMFLTILFSGGYEDSGAYILWVSSITSPHFCLVLLYIFGNTF